MFLVENIQNKRSGANAENAMFNSFIRSKLNYCSIIWNPDKKEEIDKIERIQKNFTSKIKGLEEKNYHERLRILKLYSLERRRERFLIINAWQQIEGKKENVLKLETGKVGRRRCLKSSIIPTSINDKYRTIIQNSTARQMERLFNALPYEIQNITNVETDTFKKHLDDWLRTIPDTPKIDSYGASVPAASNSIVDQCMTKWLPYMWVTRSPNKENEY